LAAAIRYLSQRFTMVTDKAKGILNDIGTEELAHLEMVGAMVTQLTQGASAADMRRLDLTLIMPTMALPFIPNLRRAYLGQRRISNPRATP